MRKRRGGYTLEKTWDIDVAKDPVRPDVPLSFRLDRSRDIFRLKDSKDEEVAIACVAYTMRVPTTIQELDDFAVQGRSVNEQIAVPYSLWSYRKGAGSKILKRFIRRVNDSRRITRLVTMSPKSEISRSFHVVKNGATVLSENPESVNYEYTLKEPAPFFPPSSKERALKRYKEGGDLHCYLCKQELPVVAFHQWEAGRTIRHRCRTCVFQIGKKSYLRHRERYIQEAAKHTQRNLERHREVDRDHKYNKRNGFLNSSNRRVQEHADMQEVKKNDKQPD